MTLLCQALGGVNMDRALTSGERLTAERSCVMSRQAVVEERGMIGNLRMV